MKTSILTPETNVFPVSEGARSRQSTSAACPWKLCNSCPLSTSHNAHVPSPLDVRIFNANKWRGGKIKAALKFGRSWYGQKTHSALWSNRRHWQLWVFNKMVNLFSLKYKVDDGWLLKTESVINYFLWCTGENHPPAYLSWWSYMQTGSLCAWPLTSFLQPSFHSCPETEDTLSIYYPGPCHTKQPRFTKKNMTSNTTFRSRRDTHPQATAQPEGA